jgi:hypothetical protein
MSIDIDLLSEVYSTLKQYVPAKDRQEASDHLMSILVDSLGDGELKDFSGFDSYTKKSFEVYVGESDSDEEENDE